MFGFLFFMLILAGTSVNSQFERDESYYTYEFAFLLAPKEKSCFYQYTHAGSKLKFSFNVLTAATAVSQNHINVEIRSPSRTSILSIHMQTEADIPVFDLVEEGDHEFCFNNYHGRFFQKKVDTYIGIKNPAHIGENLSTDAGNEGNGTAKAYGNLLEQVEVVFGNIFPMTHFMHFQRRLDLADLAILEGNLQFVNRCSLLMTLIVVLVAAAQTYALKRLFKVRITTSLRKPRA